MGVIISRILGSQIKYEGDSTTGLSAEEKTLLADSFAVLKQDLPKSGERLFIMYFEKYPDNKNYFVDFRNRSLLDLQGCPRLLFHASNVMNTLASIIQYLNDPNALVDLIQKVGYGHGRRGIKLQAFEDLKATFVLLLQEKMKSKYTPPVGEVWTKTFDVVISTFHVGVQQYIDEHKDGYERN